MPNWCENRVRLVAPDEAAAIDFEREFKAANLFNYHLPVAVTGDITASGLPRWFMEREQLWGVKWDIDPDSGTISQRGQFIDSYFHSAWGPPFKFYDYLIRNGWIVDAYYFESGMLFGGTYGSNGHRIWSHGHRELTLEGIPAYLRTAFGDEVFAWMFRDFDEGD